MALTAVLTTKEELAQRTEQLRDLELELEEMLGTLDQRRERTIDYLSERSAKTCLEIIGSGRASTQRTTGAGRSSS